jgi:3-isopropylmalate/(R)-2-methylmalate dehydratase small subunit
LTSEGRVWKFGDDVNTDLIIPGKYLDNYDPAYLAKHAMEGACKEFASSVRKGDVIVAGRNFGCGSSREQAVMALKSAGVSAVAAKSFARIFYRNAINLGLPVVISSLASETFREGEIVKVDLDGNVMTSREGDRNAAFEPLSSHLKEILDHGGLVPFLKARSR